MNTCSKTRRITVTMRDDGDMDVVIVSDCKNVQEYARRLTRISMEDITDFSKSKINDSNVREPLSIPCLCPLGVFDAAWQEVGMLSKSLCAQVHENKIILDPDIKEDKN